MQELKAAAGAAAAKGKKRAGGGKAPKAPKRAKKEDGACVGWVGCCLLLPGAWDSSGLACSWRLTLYPIGPAAAAPSSAAAEEGEEIGVAAASAEEEDDDEDAIDRSVSLLVGWLVLPLGFQPPLSLDADSSCRHLTWLPHCRLWTGRQHRRSTSSP